MFMSSSDINVIVRSNLYQKQECTLNVYVSIRHSRPCIVKPVCGTLLLAIFQYELFLSWLSKLALHDGAIKLDEMLTYPDHLFTLSVCFGVLLVVSNFVCLCLYCCIYDRGRPIIRISLSFSAFVGYTILLSFRGGRNHDPRDKTKSRSFVLRRQHILPYENALK